MTKLTSNSTQPDTDGPSDRPLRWFFGAPFRRQTYQNLLYLAIAFPFGLAAFVAISVGLSMGAGLLITLVGVPILFVTVLVAVVCADVDAQVTRLLVGVDAPRPTPLAGGVRTQADGDGIVDALTAFVAAPTTWTSLVLIPIKFVYGVLAFTILVTAFALLTAFLAAPLVYNDPTVQYTIGTVTIDTLGEAIVVTISGLVFGLVSLHLLNGLARGGGLLTATLLSIGTD